MKRPDTGNLTAKMQGRKLNIYQEADALIEFNKLMEFADTAEAKFNLVVLGDVRQQSELLFCPECKSKDIRTAIYTKYTECNKCYHYWENNSA